MNVLLPSFDEAKKPIVWKPMCGEDHLIPRFVTGSKDGMMYFTNKLPTWNSKLNGYCLNFDKRVTKASVKNFLLINPNDSIKNVNIRRPSNITVWKNG